MIDAQQSVRSVRFGPFLFNPQSGELLKHGAKIKLSGQPIELLAMLLNRPGRLVTRDELQRRLWPNDTFVEFEHSVDAAIDGLRDALGDSEDDPRYVETLPRRGYRLISPVENADEAIHVVPAPPANSVRPLQAPPVDLKGSAVSHYRIHEEIDSGGMGVVYRAEDVNLGRPVALKFLPRDLSTDPKALARFQREARTASALNHPNICTVYEVGEFEGCPFIAMELLEGLTLKSYLSGQPLSLDRIVTISGQIADALGAAHAKGIIHRDIKPANIFLTRQGITKILDFGLAKPFLASGHGGPNTVTDVSTDPTSEGPLTTPGVAVGTPAYMSPEQLRGEPLDSRTDIFSFGAVLYEMATGKQAFEGKTNAVVSDAILNRQPDPPTRLNPQLPPKFNAIIKKALEKDSTRRYAAVAELHRDLEELKDAGPRPDIKVILRFLLRRVQPPLAFIICLVVLVVPDSRHWLLQRIWPPPIPTKRSIAVLPFKAAGVGAANQAYCEGLGEAATDKLTVLTVGRSLQVTPAREIVTNGINSADAARTELGANLAFQGLCSQSGNTVRVRLALVDTGSFRSLRSETISGEYSQPFSLHNDVVLGMTRMLELEPTAREHQNLSKHGTQVPGAYSLYLLGRGYLLEFHKAEMLEKAIVLFEHSLELDPNYALAFAGLGIAYWDEYELTKAPSWVDTARLSCERATILDPQLAAAHSCTGTILNGTGDYDKARAAFRRALEIEPTSDDAYQGLAFSQEHVGQFAAAEQTYLQAIKLRPEYWPGYHWLGDYYFRQARYADAEEMFRKQVALAPESFVGYSNLGAIYLAMGRYGEAIPILNHSVAIRPSATALSNLASSYFYQKRFRESARTFEQAVKLDERSYAMWGYLGAAYYWAPGEKSRARAAFQKAVALANDQLKVNPSDTFVLRQLAVNSAMLGERQPALAYLARSHLLAPHDADLEFQAAAVHAQFGETNETIACLEKAVAWGFSRTTVLNTPDFDNLHADVRFQNLIQKR